jgi:hypothetical protein
MLPVGCQNSATSTDLGFYAVHVEESAAHAASRGSWVAQSARWVWQFVAGRLGGGFVVGALPRVREGQAMTQGGAIGNCDGRQFAGVAS